MAVGEVFCIGINEVLPSSCFDIRPAVGVEAIIHNISHSLDAQLEFYDGTNSIIIDAQAGNGAWMGLYLHCTNTKYYRVRNLGGAVNSMACDGVQTK